VPAAVAGDTGAQFVSALCEDSSGGEGALTVKAKRWTEPACYICQFPSHEGCHCCRWYTANLLTHARAHTRTRSKSDFDELLSLVTCHVLCCVRCRSRLLDWSIRRFVRGLSPSPQVLRRIQRFSTVVRRRKPVPSSLSLSLHFVPLVCNLSCIVIVRFSF